MWTDGQRTKTNPKTSPEQSAICQLVQEINKTNCSITRKTAPPPWQPYINKTNLFTNHVIQLTGTILQLKSRINETNVLTKFHENWAKNVTSKNAPPTGGHVFSPIWTIFELVQHINETIVLINFHDDWATIVTSREKLPRPLAAIFKLDRDIIRTNLLTKFHEDRTINVASRVFTNKCGRTDKDQSQKLT
ncbi:hypothetical protein DPMN_123476 [Dreissena polymorpha]|uniref:Uncharacterized protein n=1 Tax=Dreissena polymorpha TaxID=45954 RepID=A0A9D4GQY3_DREPO|nr:hypothetical protein DPMN_123476 [Dreissena polymorpha]